MAACENHEVETLTIRIPMRLQRRGGRKLIMTPDGESGAAHRHVELEVRGHLDTHGRRHAEGHEPGRRVDGPARELLCAIQVDLHRTCDRLGDGPDLDHAPRRVVLDQLEWGHGIIACPEQLTGGLILGPVLEPEAVGFAPSRRKKAISSSICACFFSPLATSHRPRASAQLTLRFSWPLPVATTVVANSGPPVAPIGNVVRKPDFVEAGHGNPEFGSKENGAGPRIKNIWSAIGATIRRDGRDGLRLRFDAEAPDELAAGAI